MKKLFLIAAALAMTACASVEQDPKTLAARQHEKEVNVGKEAYARAQFEADRSRNLSYMQSRSR